MPPLVPVKPSPSGRAPHLLLLPPPAALRDLPKGDSTCHHQTLAAMQPGRAEEEEEGEISPAPPAAAATNADRSGKGYSAPPTLKWPPGAFKAGFSLQ